MQLLRPAALLSMLTIALGANMTTRDAGASACIVKAEDKADCGFYGSNQDDCEKKNCCWQKPTSGRADEPWCYYQGRCGMADSAKQDCGYSGITKDTCEAKGCCWQQPSDWHNPWCFYGAGSSPTPAPAPIPVPVPVDPGSLEQKLLDDFKDSNIGAAFTKLTHSTWDNGPDTGGFMGIDSAHFFPTWDNAINGHWKQAVTISNTNKWVWPFHGAAFGYSTWGLMLSIREEDGYWQYFTTQDNCANQNRFGAPLWAQCGDCFANCCGRNYATNIVGRLGWSYDEWNAKKNEIVEQSGQTNVCPTIPNGGTGHEWAGRHGWNEFSSNGMSYDAVVGILNDRTGNDNGPPVGETEPDRGDVCAFMQTVNEHRSTPVTKWPIFDLTVAYDSSQLTVSGYLDCSSVNETPVVHV